VNGKILQLLKIIAVCYYEELAEDDNKYTLEELRDYLIEINKSKSQLGSGIGSEEEALEQLKNTAEWLVFDRPKDISISLIMQRLMINLNADNNYINIAEKFIDKGVEAVEARARVVSILNELRYDKKRKKLRSLIMDANKDLNFNNTVLDDGAYMRELADKVEDLGLNGGNIENLRVDGVSFDDTDKITELLEEAVAATDQGGLLNTGCRATNRALGGGIERGLYVNWSALTHNYKSGMLLDLTLNIPRFTDPWMLDNTKKPLILRISFENTLKQDIATMYKRVHAITKGENVKLPDVNIKEAVEVLKGYVEVKGYHLAMESFDPNMFTVHDLFDLLNDYMDRGYEIHAVLCDYLSLIAHNTVGDRLDTKIMKTAEMTRNFCNP